MKKTNKAFTLVELIVTITILAILWTLAFNSYAWYSIDVKNTKKISDLNKISNIITIENTRSSTSHLAFVEEWDKNKINLTYISVGWKQAINDVYDAGTLKYRTLWIKKENFLDPDLNEYRIWISTTYWWRFELASFIQKGIIKETYIKWNYEPRSDFQYQIEEAEWHMVILKNKDSNTFKSWDYVKMSDWSFKTIKKSNKNWVVLIFDDIITWLTTIQLAESETEWLISDKNDDTKIVVHWSKNRLPY